jgi:hypothetical protein
MPLIKQGAKAVGRQALHTGIQMAGDVLQNRPLKESANARLREAGTALKTKAENKVQQLLSGSGRRRTRRRRAPVKRIGPPVRKTHKRKARDIFS